MDRQLLERMIGAGVLLVALVLIAPAILDGQRGRGIAGYSDNGTGDSGSAAGTLQTSTRAGEMRRHTIVLNHEPDRPPVARPVPEPAAVMNTQKKSAKPETKRVPDQPSTAPVIANQAIVDQPQVDQPQVDQVRADQASAGLPASGWSVQLGSFTQRPNAERLASEVKSRGFRAYLEPLAQSGRTYYRVRVGPRNTRDQASELAGGLAKAGYTGQVIQQQTVP